MPSPEFEAAAERFAEAVEDNDRDELRTVRDELAHIAQQPELAAAELAAAATRLLEEESSAVGAGQCEEADPFAAAYITIMDGKAYWKCQHDPSHLVPA